MELNHDDNGTTAPGEWRWRTEPVQPAADDESWWQRWDRLNRSGTQGHPLLDSSFVRNAIRNLCDGHLLRVIGEDDLGDVALGLVRAAHNGVWSLCQPSQAPVPFLVYRGGETWEVAAPGKMTQRRPLWPLVVRIPKIDPRFFPSGLLARISVVELGKPTLSISVKADDFQTYWNSRPPSLQKSLRRSFRRLADEGLPWRFDKVTDPDAIAEAVDEYGLLESSGWKARRGTALHPGNQQGRFYRELLREYAQRGDGYVYRLWVADRIAAMRLVIAGNGMAVILKTTYDETLARFGPGRVLLYHVLQDLLNNPKVERVEFYTNANQDTLAWGTQQHPMYPVTQYRWPIVSTAAHVARHVRDFGRRLWRPRST